MDSSKLNQLLNLAEQFDAVAAKSDFPDYSGVVAGLARAAHWVSSRRRWAGWYNDGHSESSQRAKKKAAP